MNNIQINGKVYENSDAASLSAMAAMGYYVFRYFPQDHLIINADSTVEVYHCEQVYTDMPYSFIDAFVDDAYREVYAQMYDDIDAGAKKASVLFHMKQRDEMCKVTLVPTTYDADGTLTCVLGLVEDVTDVVAEEKENQRQMEVLNNKLQHHLEEQQAVTEELSAMLETEKEHSAIIEGLSTIYFAIYQLDFEEKTFQELFTKSNIHATLGAKGDARDALSDMVEKLILPETQNAMRVFNELSTMPQRIGNQKIITQEYQGVTTGWSQASIIPNDWDRHGVPTKALYCTRSIATEKEAQELQTNLIHALVVSYQDVYVLNLDTGVSSALRMSSDMAIQYGAIFAEGDYEENLVMYIEKAVLPSDQHLFDSVRTISSIKKLFRDRKRFAFTYREVHDDVPVYFQCQLIKPNEDRNEILVSLKDIDSDMQDEIKHAKRIREQIGVIQALSNKYESVFLVNPTDDTAVPYHISDDKQKDYGDRFQETLSWDTLIHGYAAADIHPDYREEFLSKTTSQNLLKELAQNDTFTYEYKSNKPVESHIYQIKAVAMPDEKTNSIIVGISDVNEERKQHLAVQQALQDAYRSAKAANNAKTDFLANMSHDIRTPMNAIIGMTAIAATHIDDKDRVQDCLKKITSSSKHLLSLINEVLDMSKIESGKIDLAEEDFNLSELIDNLLNMVRPQIEAHHHELVVNIKNVEHEQVIGDSLRIQQIFVNLMSNAVKYTPDGGKITLTITEKPSNRHHIGYYEVVFEDNGIGMSNDYMEQLFEPFSRAQDDRIRNVQGTGLGMVIARNIVNMMGGNIEVDSHLDEGSRFTVTFFLKLQEEEQISYEDFVDLPVLVVDDDEISMESACCMLNDLGMHTEGVLSGHEAIQKISTHHENQDDYFAVIIDWKMPDMDGIETTKRIRKSIGNDVLIIIISAYDWADIEQEARQAGADAFISKPLFKSRLTHLFNSLVGKEDEPNESVPLRTFEDMDLHEYRALLVEDNELNAEIATEILNMTGITVDTATDGSVAVDMIREKKDEIKYDIIFMDIQMPKMNGYDATRAIRNLGCNYCKSVPIIAMTANAFAEDVQAAFSAGMNEHIAKPLDLKSLATVLNKWILQRYA